MEIITQCQTKISFELKIRINGDLWVCDSKECVQSKSASKQKKRRGHITDDQFA